MFVMHIVLLKALRIAGFLTRGWKGLRQTGIITLFDAVATLMACCLIRPLHAVCLATPCLPKHATTR